MQPSEIASVVFIALLFAILFVWYIKAIHQPSRLSEACSTEPMHGAESASNDNHFDDEDEDDLGSPNLDDQGFMQGAGAVGASVNAGMGTAQVVSDLTTYGDADDGLAGSTNAYGEPSDMKDGMIQGSSGVRRQKSRYARAMNSERTWQLQNALSAVNQKGLRNRKAEGSRVGFRALMDDYNGTSMRMPRKATNNRFRFGMVEGHPDTAEMRRQAQSMVPTTTTPGNVQRRHVARAQSI